MVFSKDVVRARASIYLGIDFSSNVAWDMHNIIKKLLDEVIR